MTSYRSIEVIYLFIFDRLSWLFDQKLSNDK